MTRTRPLFAGLGAGLLLLLAACGGGGGGNDPLASGGSAPADANTVRVGSADFPENRLLAEIYSQALEKAGAKVERKFGIGSREVYFPGLTDGSIDLVPDYTGVLLQFIDKSATATEADEVYTALQGKVPRAADGAGQVRRRGQGRGRGHRGHRRAVRHLARELGPASGQLVFGGPSEFQTRPDGLPGIAETYGCTFKEFKALDTGGPLTVTALEDGTDPGRRPVHHRPDHRGQGLRRPGGPEEQLRRPERGAADQQGQGHPAAGRSPERGVGQADHRRAGRPEPAAELAGQAQRGVGGQGVAGLERPVTGER